MTVDLSAHDDVTIRNLWAKAKSAEDELKELHAKAQAALPPTPAELSATLRDSDDPKVAEYREALFRAEAQLQSLKEEADSYILSGYSTVTPEEAERIKAEFRAKRTAVMTILNLIKSIATQLGIEDVADVIDSYEVPNLRGVGIPSGRVSGGTGSGVPRARISAVQVARGDNVLKRWDDDKARLSVAALFMKVRAEQVFEAWVNAAGVSTWQEIKTPVTFEVSNDSSGLTYDVTIEPGE